MLYGHPDAGAYWERKCERALKECGWEKTCCQGLFIHGNTNSLLIAYVDDLRMAARAEYTPKLWGDLRKWLVVDDQSPPQRFLGVVSHYFEAPVINLAHILDHSPRVRGRAATPQKFVPKDPNKIVRGYRYQMTDFFSKSVDKFCTLGNIDRKTLKKVGTPFIDKSHDPQGCLRGYNDSDVWSQSCSA